MNFTREIKRELLTEKLDSILEKRAALSAFFRTSGSIQYDLKGLGFELVTESEKIGEYFLGLLEDVYGVSLFTDAKFDRLSGKDKLRFHCGPPKAEEILIGLGMIDRDAEGLSFKTGIQEESMQEKSGLAFIIGAFLGSGSCTLPKQDVKTGYHLEIVFSNQFIAEQFMELLSQYEILAKLIARKEYMVVYINSKEGICDFLSVLKADTALSRLEKIAEERDKSNNTNRVSNCFASNLDKSAKASAEQIIAIQTIDKIVGLDSLEKDLQVVASIRKKYPEASLQKLADNLGLSKSAFNRKIKKIISIYNLLEK